MPINDSILNFPDLYLCLCTVYCMLLATLFILIIIIIIPQARLSMSICFDTKISDRLKITTAITCCAQYTVYIHYNIKNNNQEVN